MVLRDKLNKQKALQIAPWIHTQNEQEKYLYEAAVFLGGICKYTSTIRKHER